MNGVGRNGLKVKTKKMIFTNSKIKLNLNLDPDYYKPRQCTEELNEDICVECPLYNFHTVAHPGEHYSATTEVYFCDLGYWEDDF